IVDYRGRQFIIELKIWRGNEYNQRGEKQLVAYLDFYGADQGYLLSFNFNKNKTTGIQEITCGGKHILEVTV
ncbi:MAG: ATP-binding protein, partial [Lachnospiraceae bacterium]|nr:ATP-binding protein [Lachnospiraceae bacterium]